MAIKTIESLESELGDISAQNRKNYDKLQDLLKELGIEQQTLKKKGLLPGVKEESQRKIESLKPKVEAAQKLYKESQEKKNSINAEIKTVKTKEKETKVKEATSKSAQSLLDKANQELQDAELSLSGYQGDTKYQNAYRKAKAAYDAAVKAGLKPSPISAPKIEVPETPQEQKKKAGETAAVVEDDITAFVDLLSDPKNSDLIKGVQEDLARNFGYKGPVNGKYSVPFRDAIDKIAATRDTLPNALKGTDFRTFLASKDSADLLGIKAGGSGSGAPQPYGTISNKYDAEAYIDRVFQDLLKREATASEVSALTKVLNDAEKNNLTIDKNGIKTGGFNPIIFLENTIKSGSYLNSKTKKPTAPNILGKLAEELKTKKQDVRTVYGQDLMKTAKANGITLSPMQLDAYAKQIENGTSADIIKNQIRSIASTGLPDNIKKLMADGTDLDTIYAPYKNVMYQTLELNPEAIDLNDPTLRSAIGANGEVPIYDFQRALRKDARWQYTNNAREEVANSVQQVLKDFGFMG